MLVRREASWRLMRPLPVVAALYARVAQELPRVAAEGDLGAVEMRCEGLDALVRLKPSRSLEDEYRPMARSHHATRAQDCSVTLLRQVRGSCVTAPEHAVVWRGLAAWPSKSEGRPIRLQWGEDPLASGGRTYTRGKYGCRVAVLARDVTALRLASPVLSCERAPRAWRPRLAPVPENEAWQASEMGHRRTASRFPDGAALC